MATDGQAIPGSERGVRQGSWAPLRHRTFRTLWIAAVVSNVGTWMQDVGAGWLMTSLSVSPLMVALVQAATSLPIMLLAIPAGALADIVDRRKLLIFTQTWMLLTAASLGALTLSGATTAQWLLGLTIVLGIGSAFTLPAWAAMIPELVTTQELHAAITLNGLAMNLSRAVGPALAGYLIALTSPGLVFLLNAASFIGVIAVLLRWRNAPRASALPAERMVGAVRNGLRYVRHSQPVKSVMVRAGAFFLFASAAWALLPVLVRHDLHGGPADYGMVLATIGLGAIASALLLPALRKRLEPDPLQKAGATAYAATMALMAAAPDLGWLFPATFLSGLAWLVVMASIQGIAQTSLPAWVRARGLSMVMVIIMGGMASGAALWGHVATRLSVATALQIAAICLLLGVLATWRIRVSHGASMELTPSMHLPAPAVEKEPALDRGPVLVTLSYRVDPDRLSNFLALMKRQREARRRDGAFCWQLFQDAAANDRYLETFLAESWLEHLRQHERVTQADRSLQEHIQQCLVADTTLSVTHYLAVR